MALRFAASPTMKLVMQSQAVENFINNLFIRPHSYTNLYYFSCILREMSSA